MKLTGLYILDNAKKFFIPMVLEIFFRFFRIPFFPAWSILMNEKEISKKSLITFSFISCLEIFFLGTTAFEFGLAIFLSILILNNRYGRLKYFPFSILATFIWSILGFITNKFPLGAMDLEVILTAVITRIVFLEVFSGLISRFLILSLVYLSFRFMAFFQNQAAKFLPAFFSVLFIFFNCSDKDKEYFISESPENEIRIQISNFSKTNSNIGHPLLGVGQIKNETCISCHFDKISDRKKRKSEKNPHSIHYKNEKLNLDCVFCHENAGRKTFDSEFPKEKMRNTYNQKCVICHSNPENHTLEWKRKYL